MPEKMDDIVVLLSKHINDDLSPNERLLLDEWANRSAANRKLLNDIDDHDALKQELKDFDRLWNWFGKSMSAKFENTLPGKLVEMQQPKKQAWFKWIAAACFLLIISASYFIFFNKQNVNSEITPIAKTNDVPPGTYKAKLTLDNGATIILDNAKSGELTKQGSTVVLNQEGQLVYSSSKNIASSETLYNTLTTGRGETYPATLSDGSKVWLNNETSIRYPVAFTGSERRIELNGGEAYFEVVHNSAKPFKVIVNGTEVEVLGTQFAISAFPNEQNTKTSLLTGKVKVTANDASSKILVPGNQANVDRSGSISIVKDADVQGSIAWVRGYFHFEEADMSAVLRQLARWYNIEVVNEAGISSAKIHGDVERNIPLSKVLANLEKMGNVKFKIQDRKVIVLNH